jgi:ERCC4 domain
VCVCVCACALAILAAHIGAHCATCSHSSLAAMAFAVPRNEKRTRGHSPRATAALRAGDECVLDWVAERKSADALFSSIQDGRYVRQKALLARSGAAAPLYVVVECDRAARGPLEGR